MFVGGGILKPDLNWYNGSNQSARTIAWVSGGAASAVACILISNRYNNVHFAFCDTGIEDPDTYRFMSDIERIIGINIIHYKHPKFKTPEEVHDHYSGLNFAHGAPCSSHLKREVRTSQVQDIETDYCQIFGFDFRKAEVNRAINMVKNYPEINPKFPLIESEMDRDKIFKTLKKLGIKPPRAYEEFNNNNCIGDPDSEKGGCVQGGIGYWQKIKQLYPKKFAYMAAKEHKYSEAKGKPVTICKDQRKGKSGNRLFLSFNPMFPDVETIDVIKGRQPVGYFECNGFCGTR